jgi:hypothetical protein
MQGGAYVFIALMFGLAGGIVGRLKGMSFWLWFMISGLIPFLGLLAAVFARNQRTEERRRCPGCGRLRYVSDTLCTRCGTELYFPEDEDQIVPAELPAARS